ncbi:phage upper tail fiber protein [Solibacillus silvestris]
MPDTRTYFVICEDNCKFESMTKEQIIAAIAEATGSTPTQIDDAFITKIKEQNAEASTKFWIGTKAEYNAIQSKASDVVYIIKESGEPTLIDIPNVITDYNELSGKPNIPSIITSGTSDPDENTAGYRIAGSVYFKIVE